MVVRRTLNAALALLLCALALATSSSGATATTSNLSAAAVVPPRAVGALFTLTAKGKLARHFCTATVVSSRSGDVVVTAAHCLTGRSVGSLAFVPQYHQGETPLGVWTVRDILVDSQWEGDHNPNDDFAFLIVHRTGARSPLQGSTGAESLQLTSSVGKRATVVGYPGSAGTAIACSNSLRAFSAAQLEFDCGGYTSGTSGSALVVDPNPASGLGTVVGVIGGYQQGGNTAAVSYAALFGTHARALYERAREAA